jgi:hypothetical protein
VRALTTFGILAHGVELPLRDELPLETLKKAVMQADYMLEEPMNLTSLRCEVPLLQRWG